jgi:hypothetical protein
MSAAAPADPGNTPPDRGLSDAFGVAAASSLRHAAPRRARAVKETTSPADKPAEVEGRSSEPEAVEADTSDPGHSGAAPPAAKAPRFEAGGPAPIVWVPRTRAPHATCAYSCRRPPSRSRRRTRVAALGRRGASATGGRWCSDR